MSAEPLAASLDEANARILSGRLRELEARMDAFDVLKSIILGNQESLFALEVELHELKQNNGAAVLAAPATGGEVVRDCSRATAGTTDRLTTNPESGSPPVADSFGTLVAKMDALPDKGRAFVQDVCAAAASAIEGGAIERMFENATASPASNSPTHSVDPTPTPPYGTQQVGPEAVVKKKRPGRRCGACGGEGFVPNKTNGDQPGHEPLMPCPKCEAREAKKNKKTAGGAGPPALSEATGPATASHAADHPPVASANTEGKSLLDSTTTPLVW